MMESESNSLLQEILDDQQLVNRIKNAKILLVGAGGIGCEVIKNLLLVGFTNINMIDLDTIDVSNLNRQFLFNKSHVGKSKSEIAAKVAKENFAHDDTVNIKSIHDSIQKQDYDVDFFKSHNLVINALDNRAARSHVNRMCLAADVPLIESGSEGYLGQVFLIKKNASACYDCDGPRKDQKTYASCTIRNTPSQPIHCIVWGKHLFAQLFGEEDADNDVSPDYSDPELNSQAGDVENNEANANNNRHNQQSTRQWAQVNNYDSKLLFDKLFKTDIEYLLRMDKLWESRRKPTPISYDDVQTNPYLNGRESSSTVKANSANASLKDQRLWSLKECLEYFNQSIKELRKRLETEEYLVWDKDDEIALNFVTSVSNLRSHCFGIERKSKFDVKSMAGNIIPAISSTNSIVGGLITLQAISLLRNLPENQISQEELVKTYKDSCKHIFLRKVGLNCKNLITGYDLDEPNPNCLVCYSGKQIPEIEIICSLEETTMNEFVEQILFAQLHFVCPDISLDGQPTVLWSKDDVDEMTDEEKEEMQKKVLAAFPGVKDKTRLKVFDLIQNYTIVITLKNIRVDKNDNDGLFYKITRKETQ